MSIARKLAVYRLRKFHLSKHDAAIVLASLGRAGSTLLYNAVADGVAATYLPQGLAHPHGQKASRKWVTDLSVPTYRRGVVYKTHDYPSYMPDGAPVRAIYTFADPVDIVLSLIKREQDLGAQWIARHFRHFRADFDLWPKVFEQDVLGLEAQYDAWMQKKSFPVMTIKYDALWDHQDALSEFVGVPVELPEWRERAAHSVPVSDAQRAQLAETYGPLRAKIEAAPASQVLTP